MSNTKLTEIKPQYELTSKLMRQNARAIHAFVTQLDSIRAKRKGRKSQDDVLEGELDGFLYYYSVIDWMEDKIEELNAENDALQNEM